ncbi:hypothetical protein H5P28_18675 [Ruficoccus amylovorans]|uniref:Uncharacterized protein n=1 Tax=Ruficoccus amylovorans TaxID=1804625 RepID=A0A842HL94_9BACT|nr:hypothetical protein [Ruficoccus amylovorans]MBC2596296.1 hypothetical protein [Ruficoccus amylovorans]
MSIHNELKRIEKAEQTLAKQKKKLIEQQKKEKAAHAKLETVVKQSGFDTPKELVEALIEKYGIRLHRRRAAAAAPSGRRKRTKITPELRDEVKAKLKEHSMNKVSKDMEISYAVIAKIAKGAYDKAK